MVRPGTLKVCSVPGCPTPTSSTYCAAHTPAFFDGAERPRAGTTRQWRAVRARVLKR